VVRVAQRVQHAFQRVVPSGMWLEMRVA
jgi:hypothetical protein